MRGPGHRELGVLIWTKILEDLFFAVQRTVFSSIFERKLDVPEAGKKLFAVSRKQRNTTNDSDRLGKYLEKFGLSFQKCKEC
jgi:transcriptional regulatory protein RtcR